MSAKPSNATPISLEPLTRRNIDGKVYKRNSAVEQQLMAVLPLSDELIILQARIDDKAADGYLQEEALVFLIRTSHQKNNHFLCNEISRILLIRCKDQVAYRIRAIENKEDAFNEVVQALFERILSSGNEGDYLQVRFWHALKRISVDVFRKYYHEQTQDHENLQKSSFQSEQEIGNEEDDWEHILITTDIDVPKEDGYSPVELESLKREALQSLPEPLRTAFILHYYKDWQIESKNPKELTVSSYFKKDPRTIRNWIRQAKTELRNWRGDRHE